MARRGSKGSRVIIERMRDDAEAPNVTGNAKGRAQGEEKQRTGVAPSLVVLMDRKLAKQCRRQWVGFVALLRLGQCGALDLTCAQGDVADDPSRSGVANDIGT
jgi:hypothetical protein